ncbi:rhodanese-like protein [Aeromicrobium marinum DSM 15272]|uniref:Rhodanese-like protein n=1 Tax=Aeromicrobium marinum DSM 15272 TaxID=585531 RepID=E2SBW1_9ACTN|nr:rhodanese-like domain-containing protein [Aeromicrobium marinum]EFQ83247.1 rhodanese-like protein [Aeromicrobium marinum DSM 15272]
MRLARLAVLATVAALTIGACGSSGAGSSSSVSVSAGPTASAAPSNGAEVDATEFAAALKRTGTVVVDVRTPEEFAAGHLPGAVLIDVQAPDFADRIAELDPAVPYAVYCRSANRSAVAVDLMVDAGFTSTYHLAGGIQAWQDAGGEVVAD